MSIISFLLCFTILIGTTFAWFTDTETSANNVIRSGNLDVELEYYNGTAWKTIKGASDILDPNALYEPGYTDVAYLRIKNAGTLDLKYKLGINVISENAGVNTAGNKFFLSDYVYFDVVEGVNGETSPFADRADALANATVTKTVSDGYTKDGALEAGSDYVYLAMLVYLPYSVGDVANHNGETVPQINLGINIVATQLTGEEDGFGDTQYDKMATADTEDELLETLAGEYDLIMLGADITLTDTLVIPSDKVVILDLCGYTISQVKEQTAAYSMIQNKGDLTIKDSVGTGKISYTDTSDATFYNVSNTIQNTGKLTVNGGRIENLSDLTNATNGYPHVIDTNSTSTNAEVIINGGTLYGKSYSAIRMFCNSKTYTCKVTINDGNIIGRVDFQNPNAGKNLGELTINDGFFKATNARNRALFIFGSNTTDSSGMKLSVKGGTFDGTVDAHHATMGIGPGFDFGFITGGTFNTDPSAYVKDGYGALKTGDTWEIIECIVANPTDDVASLIKNAPQGSTILLKAGNYAKISLDKIDGLWHDPNYDANVSVYQNSLSYGGPDGSLYTPGVGVYNKTLAEGLTILGEDGTVVDGIDIYSDKELYGCGYGGINTSKATAELLCVAKDLSIVNVTFTDDLSNKGSYIDGLTVKGCTFENGACINANQNQNNKASGLGNVVIENNTFVGADSDAALLETRIILANVENVSIKGNTVEASEFNAIQLGASVKGNVLIDGNTISGTNDRALRISGIEENTTIVISGNKMTNAARVKDGKNQVICIGNNNGVPATSSITFTGNTYGGAAWAEGMVIQNTAVETIICSDNTRIDG